MKTSSLFIIKRLQTIKINKDMSTINISKGTLVKLYNMSNHEQKTLLEELFGKETFTNDITERIKTFEDACKELGADNPLVKQFRSFSRAVSNKKQTTDLIVYLKLRIIAAALNEGWEPKFTKGEQRWHVWYKLISELEYDALTAAEEKEQVALRRLNSNDYHATAGIIYGQAMCDDDKSFVYYDTHLSFKTWELAKYAAIQFIELYADFYFCVQTDEKQDDSGNKQEMRGKAACHSPKSKFISVLRKMIGHMA